MPANQLILPVIPGQLPLGFCPATEQERLNGYSAVQTVQFPDSFKGVIISQTAPSDQLYAWMKVNASGLQVVPNLFNFAQGAWYSKHPLPPGFCMMWPTALPNFNSFDGGSGNPGDPATLTTGPMWEEMTELRARFPVGAGTLPSGTVLSVGGTGGEESQTVTLSMLNLPAHAHNCKGSLGGASGSGNNFFDVDESGTAPPPNPVNMTTDSVGGVDGEAQPIQISKLPRYYVVYWLRRTDRQFYQG